MNRRSTLMLVAMSVGSIAGTVVMATPVASAAGKWSIAKSPRISSAGLVDVSCPGANSCFTVGAQAHHGQFGTEETLIEHWNGHDWSVMPSPNPKGARIATLSGVSCPSRTSCFAAGNTDLLNTLIEHWNGHDWSIMKSPTPPRQLNDDTWLSGISCPGTNSCFAVGVGGYQATALAEHWNGHDWSIMKTPAHVGYRSPLRAVSCPSRTSCFAVGTSLTRTSATLVEHWNGTTWGVMPSPKPASSTGLLGVSCPDKTTCFAVGQSQAGSGPTKTLVERWNGHDWATMQSPNPVPPNNFTRDAGLAAVKCPNPNLCVAVGGFYRTLAERWGRGGSWTITPTPQPAGGSMLSGLGCRSTIGCFAVGNSYTGINGPHYTLIEQYG